MARARVGHRRRTASRIAASLTDAAIERLRGAASSAVASAAADFALAPPSPGSTRSGSVRSSGAPVGRAVAAEQVAVASAGGAPAVGGEQLADRGALQLAVLEHEGAARPQQRWPPRCRDGAARRRGRRRRRRARPPGRAAAPRDRAGSRRAGCTAGSRRPRRRCRRAVRRRPRSAASARSAKISRRLSPASSRTFCRAQTKARGEFSTATTSACGTSVAIAMAMAPDPVPRSMARGVGARHGEQRVDRDLRDRLGLGARDEDAGSDGELERAERRATGDVLQRLARGAALDRLDERPAAARGRARHPSSPSPAPARGSARARGRCSSSASTSALRMPAPREHVDAVLAQSRDGGGHGRVPGSATRRPARPAAPLRRTGCTSR